MTLDQAFQIAVRHHQASRLAEAEAIYRQILAQQPAHGEALHLLGVLTHQAGRHDDAVTLIRRAIAALPGHADCHTNLGSVFRALGRRDDAIASYRQALTLQPRSAVAHFNLGVILHEAGRCDEAIACYERALALPDPTAAMHNNLGNALKSAGRLEEAIASYRRAAALAPEAAAAHYNLGAALQDADRQEEAIAAYREAVTLEPRSAAARHNLGHVLHDAGRLEEAIACYEQALALAPRSAPLQHNLAVALKDAGRLDEAIASARHGLALQPRNPGGHSNLILNLHYLPGLETHEIAAELDQWNTTHVLPLGAPPGHPEHDRSPDRRLRLGYVSADFREHVVGRTLLPCFEAHDRGSFELFCYSGVTRAVEITARFRQPSHWREVASLSDEALAARIREDRIDILVDLSLHTAGHRLLVFARRPAPVQVTWLGYPGTTGLRSIDYRITDARLEPPGEVLDGYCEEPVRLPDCWCGYGPPADSPPPGALPAMGRGQVTFGSFNNFAKLNEPVLALWARILAAVAGSRLLLLSKASRHDRTRAFFARHGIAEDRVEFLPYYPAAAARSGKQAAPAYLERYQRIDVALDPFPYNGMTTTCDALWMGVPVVARIGRTPLGRASFSLLSTIGLPELAAASDEGYVRLAADLAGDLPRLASLRATLRERMKNSPLLDAPRLARNLETRYREIWRRWCAGA